MSRKKLTEEEKKISKDRARAKYREKNRELLREKNREYRKENPETVKESNKKWRENNKETFNAKQRRHAQKHPEKIKERWDSWYEDNKERVKFNKIKRIYGLSKEEYNRILKEQNDCCFICLCHKQTLPYETLVIDHCHKTGKIRGLLCSHCNTALGLFKDNKDSLQRAIQYLQQTAVLDSPAPMCDDGSTPEINPAIPQEDQLDNYKQ